jgi:hypothetical protein
MFVALRRGSDRRHRIRADRDSAFIQTLQLERLLPTPIQAAGVTSFQMEEKPVGTAGILRMLTP